MGSFAVAMTLHQQGWKRWKIPWPCWSGSFMARFPLQMVMSELEAVRTKEKKKFLPPPHPTPPQITVSKATKLRNKIKGMTVIWCHWECFAKCSSKDDTVMVSHCAFMCHNAFYSSCRLSDALLDNPAILSSGSDNLSDMKADVSVFCHFDLRELMPWKLMRMLHVKSKSIYCAFFPLSAFPGELAGGGGWWETCVIKSEAWQSIKAVISSQDSYGFNKLFMLHSCSLLHHRGPSAKLQP